jgi:hypothetical protein
MQRVFAQVTTAFVVASAAVLLLSVSAFAGDNPGHHYGKYGNPGHHYGQLKHKTPPPTQNPTSDPATGHSSGAGGSSNGGGLTNTSLVDVKITVIVPALPALLRAQGGSVDSGLAPGGGLDWLILVILPALMAVWLVAFTRLARVLGGRRSRVPVRAPVPTASPATL